MEEKSCNHGNVAVIISIRWMHMWVTIHDVYIVTIYDVCLVTIHVVYIVTIQDVYIVTN